MKSVLAVTALMVGLAPAIAAACDYSDESSASAAPPVLAASMPTPAASKVPASATAKTLSPKANKVAVKARTPAPEANVAAAATN
jgi:hypothetical protein